MNFIVIAGIVAVLLALRFAKPALLVWLGACWLSVFVFVNWAFTTPVPASAVQIYLSITTLALFIYAFSSRDRTEAVVGPIGKLLTEPRYTPALALVTLAIPAFVAYDVYRSRTAPVEAPFFARTIHPSPPTSITVHDAAVDLIKTENPFRHLKDTEPEAYQRHLTSGRTVYYQNCFYCHGDGLGGDGVFAHGFNPLPTNFTDPNVLPNFQSSFFFWRVSKGGPGMPDEGGPGDSAMPPWEKFLSNDEMWEALLFLYDFTGMKPRALEEHGAKE